MARVGEIRRARDFDGDDRYQLVQDSQDVAETLRAVGAAAEGGEFLLVWGGGDLAEVWVGHGVPWLDREVVCLAARG